MRTSGSRLEDIYNSCQTRYRLLLLLLTVLALFLIITAVNEGFRASTFTDEAVSIPNDSIWPERSHSNWSVLGSGIVVRRQKLIWTILDHLCDTNDSFIPLKVSAGNVIVYVHDEDEEVAFEQNDKKILKPILKLMTENTDASFIDVGANTGLFSLTVADLGNPVVAIEPFRDNIPRFCQGILASDLVGRCYIVTNALWDSHRQVKVTPGLGKHNHNYMISRTRNRKGEITNTIQLWELLDQFPMKKAGIKIGSHDNVTSVLAGAVKLFQEVEVVFVHIDWLYVLQKRYDKFVLSFLQSRGYRSYGYWKDFTLLDDQPETWPPYVFFMKGGKDNPLVSKKYSEKKGRGQQDDDEEDFNENYDDDNNAGDHKNDEYYDYGGDEEYEVDKEFNDYDPYDYLFEEEEAQDANSTSSGSVEDEWAIWSRIIQSEGGHVTTDTSKDNDDVDNDDEEGDSTWWRYTDIEAEDEDIDVWAKG